MFSQLETKSLQFLANLREDEEGAALVEYGLLVGLIALACIIAITALGTDIAALFGKISAALNKVAVP